MKVAYLENLSTTTMIDPYPSDLGKQVMKSIETLSHGLSGIGKGSYERLQVVSAPLCLSCWHTRPVFRSFPHRPAIVAKIRPILPMHVCAAAHLVSWKSSPPKFPSLRHV